jgi:hypothetical protein
VNMKLLNQFFTRIPNITGKECYISNKFADTEFPIFYTGFNIFVFVVSVFILAALYTRLRIKTRDVDLRKRNL